MKCNVCGYEMAPNAKHYCFGVQNANQSAAMPYMVVLYMAGFPDAPFIPAPPQIVPDVSITWPPLPVPSGADQEIGALKHRVGLLEEEMRKLTDRFKRKARKP